MVTFHANGGVCKIAALTTSGNKLASLPTATRSGYMFKGWYTMETGGTKVDTSMEFNADATVYAQWEKYTGVDTENEYIVTFNANGGTCSTEWLRTSDKKLASLPVPTRAGYIFKGWYTSLTDGINITTFTVFDKDIPVYAQWVENDAADGFTDITVAGTTGGVTKVTASMPLQYVASWWVLYGKDKDNMKSTSILYPAKNCDSLTFSYSNYDLISDPLLPETVYYVQFCFINDEGTTVKSNIQSFKTQGVDSGKSGQSSNQVVTAPKIISFHTDSRKAGKLNVSFRAAGAVSGYQIQYSRNKMFSSSTVTKKIKTSRTHLAKTYSGLTKGKKYYVRVRSYVKMDGKTKYGSWSKKSSVKILKK